MMRTVFLKTLPCLSRFNYLYIGVVLLWPPLSKFIMIDTGGRVPFFMNILMGLYLLMFHYRKFLSGASGLWLLWCIYALINTFFIQTPHIERPFDFIYSILVCPIMLYVSSYEYRRNSTDLLQYFTMIMLIYSVLALNGGVSMSLTESAGESINQHSISALGNIAPISMSLFCFVLCLRYYRKEIYNTLFFVCLTAIFILIMVSATRKAFGASILVILFMLIPQVLKFNKKSFIYLFLLFAFYFGVQYLMKDSIMAARFEHDAETNEYATNWFLSFVGDRAYFYVVCWEIFLNHPLFGIGLLNFEGLGYASIRIHTEYMVQLCECGIVGSLLFLLFQLRFIRPLIKLIMNSSTRNETIVVAGGYAAIIFMSFTAWTYSFPIYFFVYGIIEGYINNTLHENSYSLQRQ